MAVPLQHNNSVLANLAGTCFPLGGFKKKTFGMTFCHSELYTFQNIPFHYGLGIL